MVTPAVRREAVAYLCEAFAVSQRRACSVIGVDRTSVRYVSSRPDDQAVRARLRELAAVRRRFGYRRLHVLLDREGIMLTTRSFDGSIPRNDYRFGVAVDAKELWERGRPWSCLQVQTSVGPWILSAMR